MDYKEKTKRFDEAIEIARDYHKRLLDEDNPEWASEIEKIFPELKESKDERIRKALIHLLNEEDGYLTAIEGNIPVKDCIAWLEKQDSYYTKRDVDDAYLKGVIDTKNEIEKQYKANYQIRKDIATFIFNYKGDIKDRAKWMDYLGIEVSFAEKQGERKPQGKSALEAIKEEKVDNANKVEPKFRKGEWVVWENQYYKVNYNGCGYELVDQDGLSTSLEYGTIDENAHIWDIAKDAKDGDVLVHNNCAFIFMGIKDGIVQALEENLLDDTNPVSFGEPDKYNDYCPATKEQRDTLLKAMADAGYTFDFEKKELKRIEQKPTWSEDDKKMICWYIANLAELMHSYGAEYGKVGECIDWLNSLKDRYAWKPSEEQMKALDIAIRCGIQLGSWEEEALKSLKEQLKKI